ncbi:high choriolytic enzyme 1-like [Sinocyclocheilus rhinocerous]|uniref:high choriolytic enzyme 1-like n=1 Tax=Sinocyclocheilus rhinocerous TaxID=307959 RepID=UPI0007B877E7|nr:PREDICTED: high choriolytic enzyme 1-like [Sinocyclocheilus rhinocerous]
MDCILLFSISAVLLNLSRAFPATVAQGEFLFNPHVFFKSDIQSDDVDVFSRILQANKEISGMLLEGDMVLPTTKNAMKCLNDYCRWPKSSSGWVEVPYSIANDFYDYERTVIENAMKSIAAKTCVHFVPRTNQVDYISIENLVGFMIDDYERTVIENAMKSIAAKTCVHFVPRTNQVDYISIENLVGCSSTVGRAGGKQQLSLSVGGCVFHGIIEHELLHSLGFHHEHTRSDRDQYIWINWQNIPQASAHNFQIKDTNNLNTPYDYNSIMHYGRTAFTITYGMETIVPIPNPLVQIGQRQELSDIDIQRINKLYECAL